MRFMTMHEFLAWLAENSVPLTIAVGAVTVVILAGLIRWTIRGHRIPGAIRVIGPLMGVGWNAEATYEVLRDALGVPALVAGIGFAVFEMLMLGAAIEAEAHFNRRKRAGDTQPTLGPAKWFVFTIAGLTATAAAFNSDSVPVIIFRYAVATAVVWYWALKFMADQTGTARKTTWALSPRRIAVRLGWIDPTDADLATVHHERQVRLLVTLARKIFHGARWLRTWREARFAKASELADAAMMAEVVARITRSEMALELANPSTSEERLTQLTRQADARTRALLTSVTRVSDDADRQLTLAGPVRLTPSADVDADVSRQLTSAEPVRLTPGAPGSGAPVPRQADHGRAIGERHGGAGDARTCVPLASAGSVNSQMGDDVRRQAGGSSLDRQSVNADALTPVNADVSRQPGIVKTVNLTDLATRQAMTRLTSADAQQRLADAEAIWRQSVSDGRPLTGRELGARVGMSESWGRTAIIGFRKRDQSEQ